jgi:S-adenosylmethionine hydrolase
VSGILTMTTDFGFRDAYVPVMKGVIASIDPGVRVIDVTHDIAPQDVMEAAYVLRLAVPHYPPGTVHLVVVDPGVGTKRRCVALRKGDQKFVGPDNGIFSLLLNGETPDELVELDRAQYWRTNSPSRTFHGRDIFAPVSAHLASGRAIRDVGTSIDALDRLQWALPIHDEQGIQGWVVHIDHFGNCITNISRQAFEQNRRGRTMKCFVGNGILRDVVTTYGDVAAGEPLVLFGSSDYLEVAVNSGNASQLFDIQREHR